MLILENVTVEMPVHIQDARKSLKDLLARRVGGAIKDRSSRRVSIRALDSVSLSAPPGGRIGLIGHNGAGKTTLLKTVAGLYPITAGNIRVEGSIRTFFNLSAGLDMNRSGYTNITNLALYYTQDMREIEEIMPSIIEFSELGDFIDMPVSIYSAGMLARLIVSVALSFGGDILVMDEMLGAGDAMFMKKVKAKVVAMMESSSTLLFASHATEIIRQFCDQALWLEHGKVRMFGDVFEVTDAFHKTL